jgi:16S rRNA (uracil1498-N3)-methyltransferase
MHRVFVPTIFSGNSATIQDAEIAHRLHDVLRMRAGDQFFVFDESAAEYLAEITTIDKERVSVGFVKRIERRSEAAVRLNVYPALFKKQRFEWMLEKCTELGVAAFYPIQAEHSVVKEYGDAKAPERWRTITVSASEQSERVSVPEIHTTQLLTDAIASAKGMVLVAAERDESKTPWPALQPGDEASLFIGPEGGWSAAELELFKEANARFLSFGTRILRAETACIAGATLLLTNK